MFEGMERELRDWIAQRHKCPPSFSILQSFDNIPGLRRKHEVWFRGVAALNREIFDAPEPSDTNPDTSLHSKDETAKVLGERDETRRVKSLLEHTTTNRVFCITEKGYIGLVPHTARANDQIIFLFGGNTPIVLRGREAEGSSSVSDTERRWQLIGESYVHGFMDGEGIGWVGWRWDRCEV